MWAYLPDWAIDMLKKIPSKQVARVMQTSRTFREVADQLLREKAGDISAKAEEGYKDVMTILGERTTS